jgi:hypothetical protein
MEEKVKKKPGRPRKKPLKPSLKCNGISDTPLSTNNHMEMIYGSPIVFKRLFCLFKVMAVKNICIRFDEKSISIITTDHLKKSNVNAVIDCSKINHYYCKEATQCFLNPNTIENVIQILDKKYISIAFILKEISYTSLLNIVYRNDMKIDEYREIELVQPAVMTPVSFDTLSYPIRFTLPCKYFKKLVTDIGLFSNTLTITKVGVTPLTFTYTSKDKTVKSKHVVHCPENISLVANVADDDIFSASVQIDYIKPLSGALLSESVSIFADSNKNMIFNAVIDDGSVTLMISTCILRC